MEQTRIRTRRRVAGETTSIPLTTPEGITQAHDKAVEQHGSKGAALADSTAHQMGGAVDATDLVPVVSGPVPEHQRGETGRAYTDVSEQQVDAAIAAQRKRREGSGLSKPEVVDYVDDTKKIATPLGPVEVGAGATFDLGIQTVSVTWGEELYAPDQYYSFRIGPFSATASLHANESRADAMRRLYGELAAFAEETRRAKYAGYAEYKKGLGGRK